MRKDQELFIEKVENGFTVDSTFVDVEGENSEYKREKFIANKPNQVVKLVKAWLKQFEELKNG